MTEGEIEIGKLYRMAHQPEGAIYKKVNDVETHVVNKKGVRVGNRCKVINGMKIIPFEN